MHLDKGTIRYQYKKCSKLVVICRLYDSMHEKFKIINKRKKLETIRFLFFNIFHKIFYFAVFLHKIHKLD